MVEDLVKLLNEVKDTPFHILLFVAGLSLVFFGLGVRVGQFGIPSQRQTRSVIIGCVLVVLSVVLLFVPTRSEPAPKSDCNIEIGSERQVRELARAWAQPNVTGESGTPIYEGQIVYILAGPKKGRIDRDDEFKEGWWWQVRARNSDNVEIEGWIWSRRIEGCPLP